MGEFDGDIGPFMLGAIFATFLTGITSTQAFNYFVSFPEERWHPNWWLVLTILCLDLYHTVASIYQVYLWCVINYVNPAILAIAPWPICVDPTAVGLVTLLAQSFYVYRVWTIGGRKFLLPLIIFALSFTQLFFAIWTTAHTVATGGQFSAFPGMTWHVSLWLYSAAAADILITAGMVFYLRQNVSDFSRTNAIVETLIRNVIETNSLSCIVALLDGIFYKTLKDPWHVTLNHMLPKLYFNSVLVSLNSRSKLRAPITTTGSSQGRTPGGGMNKTSSHREDIELGSRRAQVVHVSIMESVDVDSRRTDEK